MNKVSSKLAAGVRKVKAQQANPPAAPKPSRSGGGARVARDVRGAVPAQQAPRSGAGSVQHPERVWPD
jgi:hypothetical protein